MHPSTLPALVATLRLPFLALTPACVALGLVLAWGDTGAPPWPRAALVLLGALAAHASVNVLNEWHDARSGLDALTRRTPFSGGSGALPAAPGALGAALVLGCALLAAAAACGLVLLWVLPMAARLALLPLGLAGLALVVAYTPWITRYPLACLLAPGLGFGPLMVLGTQLALAGHVTGAGMLVSLLPWLGVSGLLLLNQFPDVDADRAVGRRHLPMLWGRPRAARLLATLLALGPALLLVAVLARWLPPGAALGLLILPLAWQVARGAIAHADDLPALLPTMGRNVALSLLTPLLVAIGLRAWP